MISFHSIDEHVRRHPHEPALIDPSAKLSWREVADRTDRDTRTYCSSSIFRRAHDSRCSATTAPTRFWCMRPQFVRESEQSCQLPADVRGGRVHTAGRRSPSDLDVAGNVRDSHDRGQAAAAFRSWRNRGSASNGWTSLLQHATLEPPSIDRRGRHGPHLHVGDDWCTEGRRDADRPAPTVAHRLHLFAQHHSAGLGPHLVAGPLYHAGPHAAVGLLLTGAQVVMVGRFDAGGLSTRSRSTGSLRRSWSRLTSSGCSHCRSSEEDGPM